MFGRSWWWGVGCVIVCAGIGAAALADEAPSPSSVGAPPAGAGVRLMPATATPAEAITTLPGFQVERIYSVPSDQQGSWVSLTVDSRGRLITCDQNGSLYRVVPPAMGTGLAASVEKLEVAVGGAHGLLYANDSLYVSVNERPRTSGLYRLRDTNGDDHFDEVKLLHAYEGTGEHGPHAVVLGPDGVSLYVVAGNFTKVPLAESSRVPRLWGEDQLLPRMPDAGGHDPHIMAPAGWVAKTDLDGQRWELVNVGMRNTYDLAFNRDGELFGYDSDMEWDIGAPWYRPTRVVHLASGIDWGWRNGSGKFPVYYPDTMPSVIDVGPGSPTGVMFGYGAKFPVKYQEALYLLDWSYGIIYAAHLEPVGSSYQATLEKFVTGAPLPVTDAVIGRDGAMYFTIGGRKTQSGMYRISYAGPEATGPAAYTTGPAAQPIDRGAAARRLRSKLEQFHGRVDAAAVATCWPSLSHEDRFVRAAARIAIEHQPVDTWRSLALGERNPRAKLAALLALVRAGTASDKPRVLEALDAFNWDTLSEAEQLEGLRILALCFVRLGAATPEEAQAAAARLQGFFPAATPALNRELSALLVYLQAPDAVAKTLALLEQAPTQEEQIQYAYALRTARIGWTLEARRRFFSWFQRAADFRGGHSFAGFLKNMQREAAALLTPDEQSQLADVLVVRPTEVRPPAVLRTLVKEYAVSELLPRVEQGLSHRNYERGRSLFASAECAKCHRFNLEGGFGGPDLTQLAGRFNPRDLLESIIEPSKVISDQYQATIFVLHSGKQVVGRITNASPAGYMVTPNFLAPDDQILVRPDDIEQTLPSALSMMPTGLLNTLAEDEILDLMAYLLSRGDKQHAYFQ